MEKVTENLLAKAVQELFISCRTKIGILFHTLNTKHGDLTLTAFPALVLNLPRSHTPAIEDAIICSPLSLTIYIIF